MKKKSNSVICPSCGAENPTENKFCESCGMAMEQDDTSAASKKKSKKKIIIAITVGVLLLAAVTVAGIFFVGDKEEAKYNTKITEADKYLEDQDYEKAETAYLEAIDIDPKQEPAYIKLADTYVKQHKEGEALSILETATQELPDSKKIKAKYDEIDSSDYVQAMKAYDEFLSQDEIPIDSSWEDTNVWESSSCDFALAYISNEEVPELIVYYPQAKVKAGALYQYRDGEVKWVVAMDLDDIDSLGYYSGTGYYMEKDAEGDYSDQTIQYIDDLIYEGGSEHIAFMIMEDDGVAQFSTYEPEPGPENVGEEEYNKQLKIHTDNKELTYYEFFNNTKENREKHLLK